MTQLLIYLSGSIKKGDDDTRADEHYWTPRHENIIRASFSDCHVRLLNPAKTDIKRNDYFANYGCDLYLVSIAALILVDLRALRGIGVGAEMMFARLRNIPCVGWAPRNTYYRRDFVPNVFGEDLVDWIHPFASGLTDALGETLEQAVELSKELLAAPNSRKRPSPTEAIEYFRGVYPEVRFYGDEDP